MVKEQSPRSPHPLSKKFFVFRKKKTEQKNRKIFSLQPHFFSPRQRKDYATTTAALRESTSHAAFVRTARWREQRQQQRGAATTTVAFRASSFFFQWWRCESESESESNFFVSPSSDAIHAFDVCASFFFVSSRSAAAAARTTASKKLHRRWEWAVPASAAVAEFSVASVVSKSTGTDEWSRRVGGFVHSDEKFRERAKHRFVVVLERGE